MQQSEVDGSNEAMINETEHSNEPVIEERETSVSRRSERVRRRTQALQDGIDQGLGIVSFKSTTESADN